MKRLTEDKQPGIDEAALNLNAQFAALLGTLPITMIQTSEGPVPEVNSLIQTLIFQQKRILDLSVKVELLMGLLDGMDEGQLESVKERAEYTTKLIKKHLEEAEKAAPKIITPPKNSGIITS